MLNQHQQARLTHDILTTLMAEVVDIINSRPLVPVSTDPDAPTILTPSMLLTQKPNTNCAPLGHFDANTSYTSQWRHVQSLANSFWKRWKQDYISNLQRRPKWQDTKQSIKKGDIVLLKDKQAHRNEWQIARVVKAFLGTDGLVRHVELTTQKGDGMKKYSRPISDLVVLVSE
ncbi:uncharacterized protein [Antedon mediterranea]|uniref:uncharacterized protein n=1 Tax=Antedon mediterranea TaxID=105859 RepID=UPI003AF77E5A